jgi:RNA polymerase sigma-70 factor (ECF subfamily)
LLAAQPEDTILVVPLADALKQIPEMHSPEGQELVGPPKADSTSVSLLGRLRQHPADADAWQEFVDRYRPRIYAHCLACALQPADAEDVTQTVLAKLVARLPAFHYDPTQSFRAWLRTVTRRVLADFLAEEQRERGSGDTAILRLLANVEAREGLARQVEAEFDQELLEEALKRVRERTPTPRWEAFRLTALEGLSGAEAATRLGMLVATVYTAKSKVQKLVREELRRLEGPAEVR